MVIRKSSESGWTEYAVLGGKIEVKISNHGFGMVLFIDIHARFNEDANELRISTVEDQSYVQEVANFRLL